MSDSTDLIDSESGIRYKLPEDHEKCVWHVNYVKSSTYTNGKYNAEYGSIGPMTHSNASVIFDRMDERGTTMHCISKIPGKNY
jgi:hypothetical protein